MRAAKEAEGVRRAPSSMFLFTTEETLSLARPETIFEKIWTMRSSRELSRLGMGDIQKSNTQGDQLTPIFQPRPVNGKGAKRQ